VLRRIDKLRTEVGASVCHDEDQAAFCAAQQQQQQPERAHELFPFPHTFCEDMGLLDLTATSYGQFVASDLVPIENDLDTVFRFDESFPLMDVLDMDFGAMGASSLAQQIDTAACV